VGRLFGGRLVVPGQALVFRHQGVFIFRPAFVDQYALNRANHLALGLVEMAHAFGAAVGVDFVYFLPHVNSRVGALGFAHIAIDAFIGNAQSHGFS
jgi:hypothetical protein